MIITSRTVSEFYFFRDGIKIKDSSNTNNYLTVVSFPYTNASNVPPTIVNYVFIETNITDTIDSTTENKQGLTVVNGINNLDGYIKIPANTVLQAGAMLQFQQGVNEYYSLGCALNPYNVPDDNCLKLIKSITNYIYRAGYVIWKTKQIGNANPAISGDVSKKGENIRVRFNGNGKIEIFDNAAMRGTPVIYFTN